MVYEIVFRRTGSPVKQRTLFRGEEAPNAQVTLAFKNRSGLGFAVEQVREARCTECHAWIKDSDLSAEITETHGVRCGSCVKGSER